MKENSEPCIIRNGNIIKFCKIKRIFGENLYKITPRGRYLSFQDLPEKLRTSNFQIISESFDIFQYVYRFKNGDFQLRSKIIPKWIKS